MRISQRERYRRMRESEIAAWQDAYNVERDPGLRDVYKSFPRAPIHLVCCQLVKDVNHGGMLRLAEAFRIAEVVYSPEEDGATDFAGSRGTKVWQPFRWQPAQEALPELIAGGCQTVAITLSEKARPIDEIEWRFPLALVVGEEKFGIPSYVEEQCEVSAAIPLYGLITSLNVTTATAIALNAAVTAYSRRNPDFQPARNASRRLFGLPDAVYETSSNDET